MKNRIFKLSLLAGAMIFSGLAMAKPSATLAVKGQVSTGTCNIDLSKDDIALGNISADSLPATGSYALNSAIEFLFITCTSPLKLQFSFTDNRADSAISADLTNRGSTFNGRFMGLGKTEDGKKIGGYYFALQSIITTMNDKATYMNILGRSSKDGAWEENPNHIIYPLNNEAGITENIYTTMAEPGSLEPYPSSYTEVRYNVYPYISSELRSITDLQTIDGSVTFNVDYL
ncbi:DUF1120 domain-containing protein [Enterobacter sp. RHBSTW-00175]|uniref:DUF1120 domain-containing protein n=1 Tax=Enterobacter sp. RHBSTW-00175 TaxID=2742639 RepID=UPI0015E9CDD6|nr:DUF1120 domain-containing protein [Enterobacter sp. RHBSTW-00175]QMR75422.1 DUF1120 domain-containing protein [Enterobacter sp. RHBSTW-00175]